MKNDDYLAWIRRDILTMQAYPASPQGFRVKLDAMESPYTLPQSLSEKWKDAIGDCTVNRYPESDPVTLKNQLADHIGVPQQGALLLGNGSDELIQLLTLALANDKHYLVTPEPGFAIYKMAAMIARMHYCPVSLDENFNLDKDLILDAFEQHPCALLCLAQPNNPTGNLWDKDDLSELIAAAPGYVLIDEAYQPFVTASSALDSMALLEKYPNLLVLRTFSKIGFAGLRFGVLIGHHDIIEQLNKIRLPYNIGSLVQKGIGFVLNQYALIEAQVDKICALRETLFKTLCGLDALEVFPTQTNFILFRTPPDTADAIFAALKERGILLKNLSSDSNQRLKDCLRVTVGSAQENEIFYNELQAILHDL